LLFETCSLLENVAKAHIFSHPFHLEDFFPFEVDVFVSKPFLVFLPGLDSVEHFSHFLVDFIDIEFM
jgi:hypothetical protein